MLSQCIWYDLLSHKCTEHRQINQFGTFLKSETQYSYFKKTHVIAHIQMICELWGFKYTLIRLKNYDSNYETIFKTKCMLLSIYHT